MKKQLEELKTLVAAKDKDSLSGSKAKREAEVELEKCTSRLEDAKKQYETLRQTKAADNNTSSDHWRVSEPDIPYTTTLES